MNITNPLALILLLLIPYFVWVGRPYMAVRRWREWVSLGLRLLILSFGLTSISCATNRNEVGTNFNHVTEIPIPVGLLPAPLTSTATVMLDSLPTEKLAEAILMAVPATVTPIAILPTATATPLPTVLSTESIDTLPTPTRWVPERGKGEISLRGHVPLPEIYEGVFIANVETVISVYNLDLKNPYENSQSQFVGDFYIVANSETQQFGIIPINSAKMAQVAQISVDEASFANCEQALSQHDELLIQDIERGDSFCFLTDEGRVSFVFVDGIYGDDFASILISYKTWNPQIGSRYFEVLGGK
ncbi:MAG: hypothetical protein H6662_06675 [Ardenticatenaceae bacterium]|nr:hypothetical protein [Anaerolineales bacterium]MCB8921249.1 hypothetical protein [Ardenticatenaceae bacterium]MCB8990615.1 hypothetical protein [Ardenticatenaceae bacterium]MCB9004322.1 hypothetical protein [Ardenticatenaceae bacterium]